MVRIQSQAELQQLLLTHMDRFPPQQQQIANYLLDHLQEAPFYSVPELARRAGVSDATVVRFAQRMGYRGFSDLKMDLMEVVREQVASGQAPDLELEGNSSLAAVTKQEIINIEATQRGLNQPDFQRAAANLFKADHIYCFGSGISAYLAEVFAYMLVQIGLRATHMPPKFSSPLEPLVPLRLTDMLVIFSLPPYSRASLEVIQEAKRRAIPNLGICDRLTAPIARIADHSLTVRTENMMFTNSLGAVMVLINALTTEVAVRHGEAVEAVSRINRILQRDESLINDDS